MKRVAIVDGGARLIEARAPGDPPPGGVLVRVRFAAFNGLDSLRGRTTPEAVIGLEFSGTVVRAGPGVAALAPGDEVMGLVPAGALAEYVVAPSSTVIRRPAWLDPGTAGGALQMLTIGWDAVDQLEPGADQTVLVRGANTMIGACAVELLRERGCRVLGIVRTRRAELDRADETVTEAPPEWRGSVDRLFECVGPGFLSEDLGLLREAGRLLLLGGMGESAVTLDAPPLMQKRLRIVGTTFNSRPEADKQRIIAAVEREMLPRLRRGAVAVPVATVQPASAAAEAFERFQAGAGGKVVLAFAGG